MPEFRSDMPSNRQELLESLQKKDFYGVYVLAGEKTFTAPVVQDMLKFLLTEHEITTNLEVLHQERYTDALFLETLQTMPLFGGRKVVHLKDPPFLLVRNVVAGLGHQTDAKYIQERLFAILKRLDSDRMILLIETSDLDRRSKFYKELRESGPVLFLGGMEKGQQGMRDFVTGYLAGYGKRMDNQAMQAFLEEIGVEDMLAAVRELDKLAAAAGQKETIITADIQNVVVRHRMEQIYQLTEAMAAGNAGAALRSLHSLLEQGQAAILLLQALVNFFNQLIVMREFIDSSKVKAQENVSFDAFERQIMPAIRAFLQNELPVFMQKIPTYGLYKAYLHAMRYESGRLFALLPELLEADLAIKGEWSTKPEIPLERLVLLGMGRKCLP
ncbi:MAG: DNA polymerase III subunit delta [Dissulfuribacterales bacterium]